ncbi:MAG: 30S ribosomal protein S17 [Candidatus Gottesmanbacteria bacterium GW2011_GWA2_41_12]|uniref:Small ribosomal subunit protein uS17 n=2 Tax=Candidatus Gottesmaniibacteriota TaxID=1752720 RepID=A0A0G0WVR3_9BACT|nr:MAG: 30S ribosomal protein S17 [Candidatus Gottesmanbacteria bacterium GW2011_GWC2_39_8]KKR88510.1 MAG: 30S ribosomal protein S17 [Candidatus Gottesmanbacteria bacterium GW2011_GWA2_41_12]
MAKIITGKVVSDKMMNTVTVEVERIIRHPLYQKQIRRTRKYFADTNNISVAAGDTVKIVETSPISKFKHFKVSEKIK